MNDAIRCKECNAEIKFIRTIKGKQMPVDAKPIKGITETGVMISVYTPHWATCSNPNKFRKEK